MYARTGAGPPRVLPECDAGWCRVVLRDADAPDDAAGPRDLQRGVDGLFETHAFEHRVRTETLGQVSNSLDGVLAALAYDVRGAELLPEPDPLVVVTEQDDLLGAEPLYISVARISET
jgi:hypothetical protein